MEGDTNHLIQMTSHPKSDIDQEHNGQERSSCPETDWRMIELEKVKGKYERLQGEWDEQQEHLGRLQGEIYKLRNQLQNQSSYCASLGAILGNLVWKASRLQPVVELLLATNKLSEFFCVSTGTLVSFMETYNRDLPEVKCDEMQFVLSMSGILANIAAIPEGRQFIMVNENGKELLRHILRIIPTVSSGSGNHLKRILFMVLYNISLNQSGMLMIQDQKPLHLALSQTLLCDRSPELKLVSLRVLESITSEIPNATVLNQIQQNIPVQKIENLKETGDAEMRHFANNIVTNIKKAESQLGHF